MNYIILFLHLQRIHNFRICIHTKILHSISLICFLFSRVLDKSNKKDYLKGSFRRKYVLEILLKILNFRVIGILNDMTCSPFVGSYSGHVLEPAILHG